MLKSSARPVIRLRGVRHNNLKNFDLDLPLNQLIVITGLSGSGKSSLAFDTLFAEGQRRYIETFSPYARQFLDRMDKPQVDSIEGIPPAIAIEQRNAVKTTRSTVGTITELCDYMKMLWPHVAQLHCRQCGQPVRKDSPQTIWSALLAQGETHAADVLITFDLPLTEKLSLAESLALVSKQGYQRLLRDGRIVRLDELASGIPVKSSEINSLRDCLKNRNPCRRRRKESQISRDFGADQSLLTSSPTILKQALTVIQDRLALVKSNRARFVEACEQAYHFGKGKLAIRELDPAQLATRDPLRFSNRLHCAQCDIEYRDPSPALFSFNHPVGACPTCRGFGRVINIDYDRALPDRSRTLAQGVVKPWLTGQGAECQQDLLRTCRHFEIPTDVPFSKLPKKWQDFVIEGEPDYGNDEEHEWPRAWYGIKGYFRWLESRAYKMHVRVLLSRYRAYTQCPDCKGMRFQPEALLYRCDFGNPKSEIRNPKEGRNPKPEDGGQRSETRGESESLSDGSSVRAGGSEHGLTLADFYRLPIRDAVAFIERLADARQIRPTDPLGLVLNEVRSRLGYLNDIGLGYLTLDRPTRSLSGGETERVNLTGCLGTRLVNTLFVLDEPSVGLHPRDTERLVGIVERLRDAGNTVVVVEHEAGVMRAADQIVDLGPGHGATGGQVVFQGSFPQILKSKASLTGRYLSGAKQIEIPERRPVMAARRNSKSEIREPIAEPQSCREKAQSNSVSSASLRSFAASPTVSVGGPVLKLAHATRHNLQDVTVEIPLGRFVCVTGVSGSGKTTLIREILLPALQTELESSPDDIKASERLEPEENGADSSDPIPGRPAPDSRRSLVLSGVDHLGRVVLVDQAILGKTPRSNPAVYIGAFDDIREFFSQSELAQQRGLNASAFSFNSAQGQCERCRGAGFEKIEMQFLSDVFIRCPDCNGRRYRPHVLEIKISPSILRPDSVGTAEDTKSKVRPATVAQQGGKNPEFKVRSSKFKVQRSTFPDVRPISIADLLDATVEEAIEFLSPFEESRAAQRAAESLKLLEEVGLGYLKLGQPINTLSGGESQRLKLVRHLAEALAGAQISPAVAIKTDCAAEPALRTLFLFDEPTTGLHFDDVNVLLKVFQRLVEAGHSVVVIEHNLDVIKSADWIIDLGPEAGDQGGKVIAQGTPEAIVQCRDSYTGQALRKVL